MHQMADQHSLGVQAELIRSLTRLLEREGASVQRFETHLSWVLVEGEFAYKLKKALRFEFVDFSALEARHFYCQEELRLNRWLAPDLYLSVIGISGTPARPVMNGPGEPFEFAVKMRAFPQQALWEQRVRHGILGAEEIDALARIIAEFHRNTAIAPPGSSWGAPEALRACANENLELIGAAKNDPEDRGLEKLRAWEQAQEQTLNSLFLLRKESGFVRECHGDLHCGNILTAGGRVQVFDCIEFSESLRWIDVMNDVAFIAMDLQFRDRPDLAARLVDHYVEASGDHDGLAVLRYYRTSRALVRSKVAFLRAGQFPPDSTDASDALGLGNKYLNFAAQAIQPSRATIMITYGYSGSGKSTFSGMLLEKIGAIRLRSDVERKRIIGPPPATVTGGPTETGLYDPAVTRALYDRLAALTRTIVEAGLPVIVDATFLHRWQRSIFRKLADELGVALIILDVRAEPATMRTRILERARRGGDPSDADLDVLDHQLAHDEALTEDEMAQVLVIDSASDGIPETLRKIAEEVMQDAGSITHSRAL
jgi:aminoglycoside phosphotransferase family enzyme/predicted kinase